MAILGAGYFAKGFVFTGDFIDLIIAASIVTAINVFIRPILKLILTPFILISLGLFIIVINAFIIYILDILSSSITINNLMSLIVATLITSAINFVINFSAKSLYRKTSP